MPSCEDCIHFVVCRKIAKSPAVFRGCALFTDHAQFVKLPCKVGDTVYIIVKISGKEEIMQDNVESIEISCFDDNKPLIQFDGVKTCDWDSDDFGKRVFLAQEEAEQALQALKGSESNAR